MKQETRYCECGSVAVWLVTSGEFPQRLTGGESSAVGFAPHWVFCESHYVMDTAWKIVRNLRKKAVAR